MRRYVKVDRESCTKECADCRISKPISEFHIRKTGSVYSYCRECNTRRATKWSAENRERKNATQRAKHATRSLTEKREIYYRNKYGMSFQGVIDLLEKQSFMCEICGKGIDEKTVVIDHCHSGTGVRGALCNLCNISLAPIEREGFLEAALSYLERHRSRS